MLSETKKDVIRRMKIAQGQINKVMKMIEEEEYCPDILNQSLAVQNALKQVDAKLLEGHLKTCVKHQMQKGDTTKAVKELLQIYKLSQKK